MTAETSPVPLVSVIVPVRDNLDGCRALLRCLAAQTLPQDRFEVVIGDDGSRPPVLGILETGGDARVRVVAGPPKTSYAARNRAVQVARGRILAFCDSDCLPEPAWLEAGVAALAEAAVVAGEVTFAAPSRPTVWSLLTIDMFLDQERNVRRSRAATANLFVRRADFERWGGFDESLPSGGDYDFTLRAVTQGARLVYEPCAVVRHPTLDDAGSFLRKVWKTSQWSAVRRRRGEAGVHFTAALSFVPILGAVLTRRRTLRPTRRLDRHRLRRAGLTATWRDDLVALPVVYSLVAYVASTASACGWIRGQIERRRGSSATSD